MRNPSTRLGMPPGLVVAYLNQVRCEAARTSLGEWMKLAIEEIRRLADETAKQENPAFRVIGVTGGDGGTGYVEVLIDMVDCAHEPCRIMVGLDRYTSVASLRTDIVEALRAHNWG